MGRRLTIQINESESELLLIQRTKNDLRSFKKLECLLHIKRKSYTKLEAVAASVSISGSTLDKWLRIYREKGITDYLAPIKGKRVSKLITPEIHKGLLKRLQSQDNTFSGYWDAQQWLKSQYGVEIQYQWLWKYMTTKLGAKFKVPRKSNVKKDVQVVEAFKKTTRYHRED